ncbi:MAG: nucleoside triphosphate pyrophosphohydrolase [Lentisphaerae bacterium GWF2_45_14]|nr:MAG: nucleoside triphosphate pyrophosphohydrolase [Lentisphaerae bacterium GWF2_45_14]
MTDEKDWIRKLASVMRKLRGPDGCPWDREQTHKSLKKYLMEECAELLDALDSGENDAIMEELGDILMHIVLHSTIAEERGGFDLDAVAKSVTEKMIRRHPHVFGTESVNSSSDVVDLWEKVKKKEKEGREDLIMNGIPCHMPALLQAEKVQKKAAKFGFDWKSEFQIVEKIEEELAELKEAMDSGDNVHIDEEIGDLLFAIANLSRFRNGPSGEELLAASVRKFKNRFTHIEKSVNAAGRGLEESSIDEMENLWQDAKLKGIR